MQIKAFHTRPEASYAYACVASEDNYYTKHAYACLRHALLHKLSQIQDYENHKFFLHFSFLNASKTLNKLVLSILWNICQPSLLLRGCVWFKNFFVFLIIVC